MKMFIDHRLIIREDGISAILYLDQELTEFAKEYNEIEKVEQKTIEKSVVEYIKEKLPDIKVKTVNIMLGSLLVTSLPFAALEAKADTNISQTVNQVSSTYTVKYGDTLYKIANKFNTSVQNLKEINGLKSDYIIAGQTLKISDNMYKDYIVQRGDTLYIISKKFSTTIEELKLINGLKSNMILVGQHLKVPKVNYYYKYIVKAGDTLYTISKQFKVSMEEIKRANGIIGNEIYVGQSIEIPNSDNDVIVTNTEDILVLVNKNNRLPSEYIPSNLVVPSVPFSFEGYHSKKLMRQDAAYALESLFRHAKEDGIDIYAISGYRSYSRQEYIFTSKVMERGIDVANMTSAKPGESEHQTGLAMDVTSPSVNFALTKYFGETNEGKWLKENAYKHGFIIRYPEGKEHITGYSYEPWHIRYVGENAAKFIMNENITLEKYLGKQ